jgi:hypothetical protein
MSRDGNLPDSVWHATAQKFCWTHRLMPFCMKSLMTLPHKPISVFLATTVALLLSVNHSLGVFCQVAFPHILESTKRLNFRLASVNSPLIGLVRSHPFIAIELSVLVILPKM